MVVPMYLYILRAVLSRNNTEVFIRLTGYGRVELSVIPITCLLSGTCDYEIRNGNLVSLFDLPIPKTESIPAVPQSPSLRIST